MAIYYIYFFLIFLIAILNGYKYNKISWIVAMFITILFIGLRHDVGGDWGAYLQMYESIKDISLLDALRYTDPAYGLINWIVGNVGGGIYVVNIICALIFVYGLQKFCKYLPYPWFAFLALVPYMVIVVGMGYTRQAVAVGLVFWSLQELLQGNVRKSLVISFFSILFHKTAIVSFIFYLLYGKRNIKIISLVFITGAIFVLAYWNSLVSLFHNYIVADYLYSHGSTMRLLIVLPFAILILLFGNVILPKNISRFWKKVSYLILGLLVLNIFATTVADRMSLYFYTIQAVGCCYLLNSLKYGIEKMFVANVFLYCYLGILTVWLLFGVHAESWIPYKMALFNAY